MATTIKQIITIKIEVFNPESLKVYNNDGYDSEIYYNPVYFGANRKPKNLIATTLKWRGDSQSLRQHIWADFKRCFWKKDQSSFSDPIQNLTRAGIDNNNKVSIPCMGIVTPILLIESEAYRPHAEVVVKAANFLAFLMNKQEELDYLQFRELLASFGIIES
ncbi:hypothetical protein [Planktothrix paucivesiculata]|uniref:Uncharacterized protein n=1 Tax=Planktothrix paucivesiculata PCC 9631 TaxID=671071 RepID=A0A7Z9BZA6_9CYAN|nr:hypothetical protein [Planktothrix paucivesiculata]VXD10674.1 hypothetical protein PL9631_1000019 [Planktothrix paucivesiculata PCC 9631]VXD24359.1 hypothetical protein PL9631_790078 [Planktothrix paucivesiculata PCC 9631]